MTTEAQISALISSIGVELDDDKSKSLRSELIKLVKSDEDDAKKQIEAIKSKNDDLLGQVKMLKDGLKKIPEGFDENKWNELLEMQKQSEEDKLKSEQRWDELKTKLNESHAKELSKVSERNKFLESTLHDEMINTVAYSAIAESNGNATLLLPHVKSNLKLIESDGGKFNVIVVDDKGEKRINPEKNGEDFTIKELMAEMQTSQAFQSAFTSGNAGGGAAGSGQGTGLPAGANPFDRKSAHYNLTEQVKMKRDNPELAERMRLAAGA